MPKPQQAARSLRRYRGRARSRLAALARNRNPPLTGLGRSTSPIEQTSKSPQPLTASRGPLNTGRDPYGDAVSVRLQIGTLSGFVSERRPASNRRGVRLQIGIGVRLRRNSHQDFFSDGISEQLTTVLSHFDTLRVLARNTTFAYKKKAIDVQELGRQLNAQYVIEGSFRRVADRISVAAQLIDARAGTHVWAETFEQPTASSNLLAIQDDITKRIGAAAGTHGLAQSQERSWGGYAISQLPSFPLMNAP